MRAQYSYKVGEMGCQTTAQLIVNPPSLTSAPHPQLGPRALTLPNVGIITHAASSEMTPTAIERL